MISSHTFLTARAILHIGVLITTLLWIVGCGDTVPNQVSSETSQFLVAEESDTPTETGTSTDATTTKSSTNHLSDSSFPEIDKTKRTPNDLGSTETNTQPLHDTSSNEGDSLPNRSFPANARSTADSLPVPRANPEELLHKIGQIEQQVERGQMPGSTPEQQEAAFIQMMKIRREAAEQILNQPAEPHQQVLAKLAKLDSINALAAIGVAEMTSEFLAYAEELTGDENTEVRLAGIKGKLESLRMLSAQDDPQFKEDFETYVTQCVASDDENIRTAGILAKVNLLMQLTESGDQQASTELEGYLDALMESENEEVRFTAINSKLEILGQFIAADLPGAREQVEEFASSLQNDPNPQISEMVNITLFSLHLRDLDSGAEPDPTKAIDALRTLLEKSPKTPTLFQSTQIAIDVLRKQGYSTEWKQAIQLIANAFQDNENEQIAAAANNLALRAELVAFHTIVNDVMRGRGDAESIVTAAGELLASEPGPTKLQLIVRAAQALEFSGQMPLAKSLYDLLHVTFSQHEDAQLRNAALEIVEKGRARANMIGKPIELTGNLSTNQPFDWEPYRGKVVLVEFWATWCQPCIQELPNLLKHYEQFQQSGFDVVGVNMDQNPETAQQFIESNQIPWANIVSDEFGSNPNVTRYSVEAIPFAILVGRDGNIAVLHARGPNLGDQIEKLLAEPTNVTSPAS